MNKGLNILNSILQRFAGDLAKHISYELEKFLDYEKSSTTRNGTLHDVFFDLLRNRHRNILPVTFHCSGDTSVTAMLVFVIFECHRMV